MNELSSNLLSKIYDPFTHQPFKNAHQVNCSKHGGHQFELETAVMLFGEMQGKVCSKPGKCPIFTCEGTVTKYKPNPRFQEVVNAILLTGDPFILSKLLPAEFTLNLDNPACITKDYLEIEFQNKTDEQAGILHFSLAKGVSGYFVFRFTFSHQNQKNKFKQALPNFHHLEFTYDMESEGLGKKLNIRTSDYQAFLTIINFIRENNHFDDKAHLKLTKVLGILEEQRVQDY